MNKSTNYISSDIYYQSQQLENEYYQFINNNDKININHITGGVSSGISNSATYVSKNGFKIDIWKDISFIKLLRGRKELILEWINQFNINKPDDNSISEFYKKIETLKFNNSQQRQAYIKRYLPIDEDLKIQDLQEIIKIPNYIKWKKINSYLINKIKILAEKHGYKDINLDRQIYSLKKILLEDKARCTSGLHTFLKILNQENTNYLNKSDSNKDFLVILNLSTTNQDDQKIYDEKRQKLNNKWQEKIDNQLEFKYIPKLQVGSTIIFESNDFKDINYKITEELLKKYKIGDTIKISRQELDFDNRFQLDLLQENFVNKNLKKPIRFEKKYYLNYNSDEENNIHEFVKNTIIEFIKEANKNYS